MPKAPKSIERGDIYHVSLNPISGHEQAGNRYVLVVTRRLFNDLGTPFVCPITQGGDFARSRGFAVALSGAGLKSQGVILCNQLRALDLKERKATFVEKAPDYILHEVIARLQAVLD